jgi:TetR/AcrR family transcriptional repressor of nem operon
MDGLTMVDRAAITRERILAAAEPLVLRQGFTGTSLEDILGAAGLTKGAFFHHFKDKSAFARALIERYARNDFATLDRLAAEADAAHDDPLDQILYFVKLFEDFLSGLTEPVIGCLFATYTYESLQFEPSVNAFIAQNLRRWSALYEKRFEAVLARYRPTRPATARELSDMIMAVLEGGFILSRNFNDPMLVVRLSRQYRQYLELLFARNGGGSVA